MNCGNFPTVCISTSTWPSRKYRRAKTLSLYHFLHLVGYWKSAGPDHSIPDEDPKVGYWRPFVFRTENYGVEEITDWVMHEYRASFIQVYNKIFLKSFNK